MMPPRIRQIIEMDPDKMPFIQKVLWWCIVVIEARIQKIEKQFEDAGEEPPKNRWRP